MKTKVKKSGRILIINACLLILSFTMWGCSKSGSSATPGANEVFIQGMAFTPGSITVAANTTITWTNKDGVSHTVTSDTGVTPSFDSGTINPNKTWSHLFATSGTFPYHCTIHPNMTATVVVD
jgi:plastocyanin